jgi:protein O-mannosyl-transferase
VNPFRQFAVRIVERFPNASALAVLAALCLVAYANSLPNPFQFDDIQGIVRNPTIRDLDRIPSYFTDIATSALATGRDWRPILQTTYALNYAMGGLNPIGYRITNLLLHIGTSWLIFLVVGEIFRLGRIAITPLSATTPGLMAAFLFAIHPVNSEAVNYIWARSSVLMALFYLLAFYCFLRGPRSEQPQSRNWHAAGLVSFVLSIGTKAAGVTLPAVLVLYEVLFRNPYSVNPLKLFWKEPRRLIKYLPITLLCFAYIGFRFIYLSGFFKRVGSATSQVTGTVYLFTQFRAWIYYIRLFLWPNPLITDYPGFGWSYSFWDTGVILSFCAIATILIVAWRIRRSQPVTALFTLWFFVVLLPEASFIPLLDAVTGYRAYLANAGLAVVAALLSANALSWVWSRKAAKVREIGSGLRVGYGIAVGAIISVLVVATVVRNYTWRTETSLWNNIVAKDPTNSRAYANLGLLAIERGDYPKAQDLLDRSIMLSPKSADGYMLRGYLSLVLEKYDRALDDLNKAVEANPRAPFNYYYRGELFRKTGEFDKALADYRSALAILPFYTDAYLGMALVHMDRHETEEAITLCKKMIANDPDDVRGYHCLGILFMENKRYVEAIRAYQRGVQRKPSDAELWYLLGMAYEAYGMHPAAREAFGNAESLQRPGQ